MTAIPGFQRLHAIVRGRVQGVFFRAWTQELAWELGLKGWVKNLPDGSVEIMAQGNKGVLEKFLTRCRKGPPAARVSEVDSQWDDPSEELYDFEIRRG